MKYDRFAHNMIKLRKSLGKSRTAFAMDVGVSEYTPAVWEQGKGLPSPSSRYAIYMGYGIPFGKLLFGDFDPEDIQASGRSWRQEHGVSLSARLHEAAGTQTAFHEAAKSMGINDTSCYGYFSGLYSPKPDVVRKIAQYYGISPEWLAGDTY